MAAEGKRKPPATELQKRVATGVLGGAALVALITAGGKLGCALLAAVMAVGMLHEYVGMTLQLSDRGEKRSVLLGIAWLTAVANFLVGGAEYGLLLIVFIVLFTYFLLAARRHTGPDYDRHFTELAYAFFGMVYLGFLPLFLPQIRGQSGGLHWVLIFFICVWAGDTGAYFAGRKYGRRKLYPEVSPKKTVEGAIGGLLAGWVVVLIYKFVAFRELSFFGATVIALTVGISSQVGDLCESLLKRAFHTKDSGRILPGHGGLMDRFDGVVFALPVMYLCVRFFE